MEHSSPSISEDRNGETPNHLHEHHHMSGSDGSSGGNASDDADFEMQDGVLSQHDDGVGQDRESSADSSRLSKRKSPVAEEEFIQANPELYGLRRSVCCSARSRYLCHND